MSDVSIRGRIIHVLATLSVGLQAESNGDEKSLAEAIDLAVPALIEAKHSLLMLRRIEGPVIHIVPARDFHDRKLADAET